MPTVTWKYRFDDVNLDDPALNIVTWSTITATATCEAYKVATDAILDSENTTYVEKNGDLVNVWVYPVTPGFTTWMSNTKSNCGSRCTEVWALQAADNVVTLSLIPIFSM